MREDIAQCQNIPSACALMKSLRHFYTRASSRSLYSVSDEDDLTHRRVICAQHCDPRRGGLNGKKRSKLKGLEKAYVNHNVCVPPNNISLPGIAPLQSAI